MVRDGGKCSLLGCLETKLHPSFWHLFSSHGSRMDGRKRWIYHHNHFSRHAWPERITATTTKLPPPLSVLSSSLSPPILLSVHVVCLSKSSGWKTQMCVRLCFLNIYTHSNKKDERKETFQKSSFIFMTFYLTWLGVTLLLAMEL